MMELLGQHERYRSGCLNMMPSENRASREVLALLGSDLSNRYTLPLDGDVHGAFVENAYGGTRYVDEIEAAAEELAREAYGVEHACLKPLSGHVAGMIMLASACKRGDLVMAIDPMNGGYDGYMKDYMPEMLGLRVQTIPFLVEEGTVDPQATAGMVRRERPRLVILGASEIVFPYDIPPIAEACREVGATLGYDGSHVLGLIAGGEFQSPFKEGVDVLIGSTHKSLFGPQGGLLLTNDDQLMGQVQRNLTWRTIDNAHWNRIAGLGQALEEMLHFGKEYAKQVVRNSRALAAALDGSGVRVKYGHRGFTASHQVHLDVGSMGEDLGLDPPALSKRLEGNGVIVDAIGRVGTNEATRMGLAEEDMAEIANLMGRAARDDADVKGDVQTIISKQKMKYCF